MCDYPAAPGEVRGCFERIAEASSVVEVANQIPESGERVAYWESVYQRNRADSVSWYQTEPVVSLELVDLLGISAEAGVIDVGEARRSCSMRCCTGASPTSPFSTPPSPRCRRAENAWVPMHRWSGSLTIC